MYLAIVVLLNVVLPVVSIIVESFLAPGATPVAIAGAIFYGAAGVQHVMQKGKSGNETLAMATDLLAFVVLAAYVLYVWMN